MKIKYFLKIVFYLVIIMVFGVFLFKTKVSSPAIASYDHDIAPIVRITNRYNPKFKDRFHPQNKVFQKKVTVPVKTTVKEPFYKYFNPFKLISEQGFKKQDFIIRKKFFRKQTVIRKKSEYINLNYKIHHCRHYHLDNMMYLRRNYPIWSVPYRPGAMMVSATNALARAHQAVKVVATAKAQHHIFYEINSAGHTYGWIPKVALRKDRIYQMPFRYYSQLYPLDAPDACEAVSLRMALSVKGKDPRMSMKKFIDQVPRSRDPYKGYTASPFKYGDGASIYPKALAKYGRKYDKNVYPFTGITAKRLVQELKRGNPVVFEGAYRMKSDDSDHTLVLIGYSDGELEFADPYYKKGEDKPISWVSIPRFEQLFHQRVRGARAVVVM